MLIEFLWETPWKIHIVSGEEGGKIKNLRETEDSRERERERERERIKLNQDRVQ